MTELASDPGANDSTRTITPWRIVVVAAAVLIAALALYWFVLRTTYEPVLTSVPPENAGDIVKVLDAKKIGYRLADRGTTILVPSDQADIARIELVGSELPMRGQVGFEIFNQSDMGLTEFSQKINYQRALQGELARTLLMLDGIQSVRVHLGLAERNLFRDDQSRPKASVALVLKPGTILTEHRVSGIQRLVAGAVPDLLPQAVAVLDETGKIVSRDDVTAIAPLTATEARLRIYRDNIYGALRRTSPDLHFGVVVSLQVSGRSPANNDGTAVGSMASPGSRDGHDALKVAVTTPAPLDEAAQREIGVIIRQTLGSSVGAISISFLIGDPGLLASRALPAQSPADHVVATSTRELGQVADDTFASPWLLLAPLLLLLFLLLVAFAIWSDSRRSSRRGQTLGSFAQQLRERLARLPETAT